MHTLDQIAQQAERAIQMTKTVRDAAFIPSSSKTAPVFSLKELLRVVKIERHTFARRVQKGDLPAGQRAPNGRVEFTLEEVQIWARAYGRAVTLPQGRHAAVVTIANSKGGVGKTTTTMCIGQALSLQGYKVLLIDLDPQGSLSSLAGFIETEISADMTIVPFVEGEFDWLDYAVRPTYWHGLDIICSDTSVFGAEFTIPARAMQENDYDFYNVMESGISQLKEKYDVILIDCAPTMSYLTFNAIWASNGLIVPMPPRGMDFTSSAQFWRLFASLGQQIATQRQISKSWDFVDILMSIVDANDPNTAMVQSIISDTYGGMVVPVEIPKTTVSSGAGAEFSTVYDITKFSGSAKTYERARNAYDRVIEIVENQIKDSWGKQNG